MWKNRCIRGTSAVPEVNAGAVGHKHSARRIPGPMYEFKSILYPCGRTRVWPGHPPVHGPVCDMVLKIISTIPAGPRSGLAGALASARLAFRVIRY